uniref:Transposase (Putative), gypsy type n=1 Tax=Tanacetum cinerariifolium TaxID=118510 RepID=A0A6L2L4R3_TANCI|nr:hypothetical protein [Tanacetum cinerariifolium]
MFENDMKNRIYTLFKNDLKDLVKTYRIPLDLHPRLPDPRFTMDHLPGDAIGIYFEFLWFSGVRIPFLTFFLSMLKYFKMSIYDFMTLLPWGDAKVAEESHHLSSLVLERVLLHTTAPAAECAMVMVHLASDTAPEPSQPSKKRKLKKRALEAGSSAPKLGQAEGMNEADLTDICAKIENSLERGEGTSTRVASAPTPRLGKGLGDPPSMAVVSASGSSHVRTSVHDSTFGRSFSLGGAAVSGHARKSEAEVVRHRMDPLDSLACSALARDVEYDQIPEDDYGTATRGASSPPYTKEEWNGLHVSEDNILCKDIFKDPDVYMKALDRTITPAELKRTESLLPLDLSNRFNVLSALLVSHGAELNSRYTGLVIARNRLQEKFDRKAGYVKVLCLEVTTLDGKLEMMQNDCDALGQENSEMRSQKDVASDKVKELHTELTEARVASIGFSEELSKTDAKLSDQALVVRDFHNQLALEKAKSQGYKDAVNGLREEVTQFVGSGVENLVLKLLSSDGFHVALVRVASLGINYGVEKGLRMGRTDAEFEVAAQKVSNFHIGAKADFDRALVDFPTTPFPFLGKIVAGAGGTHFEVIQVLPDKHSRSPTSVPVAPPIANEDANQVLLEHASDDSAASI